jgi:sensor histidine kinase YesM
MKLFKSGFAESMLIGVSLILLWAPAVYIIEGMDLQKFLVSYKYRTWMNIFGLLTSLFIFHIIPILIPKNSFRTTGISFGVLIVLFLLTIGYINWLKLGMLINTYPKEEATMINAGYWIRTVIYQLYGIAYFSSFKLLLRYLKLKDRNHQLLMEKKTSELNFLKSQTNPHFLFNTLNGIYALAREKSDITADSILRLSDILRFMIYESQSELISINKEIEIIEDYIELEKMRYDETLKIVFEKDIDDFEQKIPPLLLIHLVENAFKHGLSETIHAPFISIILSIKNNKLVFKVNNSFVNRDHTEEQKENIGLTNLRRQLGLLFKEHNLIITKEQQSFLVHLEINLNSYAKD